MDLLWINALIFHGNAQPHMLNFTKEFIASKNSILLKQPPYLPDTNILGRFVFLKTELERTNLHFNDSNDREYLNQALAKIIPAMMDHQFEK